MTDLYNLKILQCRLNHIEFTRFAYTWANDCFTRREMRVMPSLNSVQNLVNIIVQFEKDREHEHDWNEKMHQALIELTLKISRYIKFLIMKSLYFIKCMRLISNNTLT